jgi:hypothetical protein
LLPTLYSNYTYIHSLSDKIMMWNEQEIHPIRP